MNCPNCKKDLVYGTTCTDYPCVVLRVAVEERAMGTENVEVPVIEEAPKKSKKK